MTAALIAIGALVYTAWLLEVVLSTGLDPVRTYVSELAAQDQPFGGLFRATDLAAGSLVCAGAALALAHTLRARHAPRRPWTVIGWAGVMFFGAATAVDSRLPLSCTPTADPECAARETAGLVPATHTAHAVSSSLAMTGALVGIVALTVAARRYGRWPELARFGPLLVALELLVTGWTLASIAAFEAGNGTWALGAGQRLQVFFVAVWLGLLALSVARETRRSPNRERRDREDTERTTDPRSAGGTGRPEAVAG
ncbi:DUF998 domain-containing protein [Streptomyces qinzhouensis]|uniref:DUF998 domain-containing protein n=1 Tax=Streptomyces qinzhouensis TaxID=2599401 RepID=A0A5B8IGR0_9ACTN|nr:DUF998 domain-containing protein [Streptomyces qinzhouensis]QDY76479.1 DUF998 domain-containing protein [Streptomyces qinzhouensis]